MIFKLLDKTAEETMTVVRELRRKGLVQGIDFDFAYHQAKWDPLTHHAVENKHAVFVFHNEKEGLLFALKWV